MKSLLVYFIKEMFVCEQKNDFVEIIYSRALDDSKYLITLFCIILASITLLSLSLLLLIKFFISFVYIGPDVITFLSAVFGICLSLLVFKVSITKLSNKIELYKNIVEVKNNVEYSNFFSPLITEFQKEHRELKESLFNG